MAKGTILTSGKGGGGGGSSTSAFNETPTGDKDHTNKLFSTFYQFVTGTLNVYYNGQRMAVIDFTENGNSEFEFIYVKPYLVDSLLIDYTIRT